jgi:peptidoglycan/xylan/chitin deacetylase (PgdA/CDA1 family)
MALGAGALGLAGCRSLVGPEALGEDALPQAKAGMSAAGFSEDRPWNGRRAAFTLTVDDGRTHGLVFAQVLARLNAPLTAFMISGAMGAPGRLNRYQLLWLRSCGHEIGSHTRTHPHLMTVSPEALDDELAGSRAELEDALGAPCPSFAYPYAEYDARVVAATQRVYASARGGWRPPAEAEWGDIPLFAAPATLGVHYFQQFPEAEVRRRVRGTVAQYKANRWWGISGVHTLKDIDADHLRWVMEEIVADPDVWVASFGQVMAFYISAAPERAVAPAETPQPGSREIRTVAGNMSDITCEE